MKMLVKSMRSPLASPRCINDLNAVMAGQGKLRDDAFSENESLLESLPFDLLVRILCLLHHDELKAAFHVSQKVRKAVLVAKQCYFNYTTPDRSRIEKLLLTTARSEEHRPSVKVKQSPVTPKAPRHGQRPPSRVLHAEMKQISACLFQGSLSRCLSRKRRSGSSRRLASHRVLFYEDELCKAVAQNRLH